MAQRVVPESLRPTSSGPLLPRRRKCALTCFNYHSRVQRKGPSASPRAAKVLSPSLAFETDDDALAWAGQPNARLSLDDVARIIDPEKRAAAVVLSDFKVTCPCLEQIYDSLCPNVAESADLALQRLTAVPVTAQHPRKIAMAPSLAAHLRKGQAVRIKRSFTNTAVPSDFVHEPISDEHD